MKKTAIALSMALLLSNAFATDSGGNSVYIDQTNADQSSLTITQTGSGNKIGDPTNLVTPAFLIDGNTMILVMTQDGMNNTIIGNFIGGNGTGNITQVGNTNTTKLNMGNFGTGSGNLAKTIYGDNNYTELNIGTTSNAGNYNYTLNIGSPTNNSNSNSVISTVNSKYTDNTISILGSNNTITTAQLGANGTSLTRGHQLSLNVIGSSNTISITQDGVTNPNVIAINHTGSNSAITINQH